MESKQPRPVHNTGDETTMPAGWAEAGGGRHLLARYANYFMVGHNSNEFIVDFGQCDVDGEAQNIHTRIVTAPYYAKALLGVLKQSLEQYESEFGSID